MIMPPGVILAAIASIANLMHRFTLRITTW